jgi:hypothetical protein
MVRIFYYFWTASAVIFSFSLYRPATVVTAQPVTQSTAAAPPPVDEQRLHQHPHHFRPQNVETTLYSQERMRLKQVMELLSEQNITIGGFYHTSTRGEYWPEVINEQLKLLDGYFFMPKFNSTDKELAKGAYHEMRPQGKGPHGLMDLTEDLFIGVHGDDTGRARIMQYIKNLSLSYHSKTRYEERNSIPRGHWG